MIPGASPLALLAAAVLLGGCRSAGAQTAAPSETVAADAGNVTTYCTIREGQQINFDLEG